MSWPCHLQLTVFIISLPDGSLAYTCSCSGLYSTQKKLCPKKFENLKKDNKNHQSCVSKKNDFLSDLLMLHLFNISC